MTSTQIPGATDVTDPATDPATDLALDVRGLKKVYDGQGRSVEAVRDLTFSIERGSLVCIVGPSGAGKTTLLRCIAGLLGITDGEVVLDGERVTSPPAGMAVVFQEYGRSLFPWMTVRQNVELPLKEKGLRRAERRRLVDEALAAVGLTDSEDAHPWQLSGGMQQRVAIARAVAYEPTVLLMDEPFAAVDAQTRADLEDLVRTLWKRLGVTVLFVTHDIDEAVYLGQRVLVLSNRPTVILEDVAIDLPDERDQLETRSTPRFAELRHHVYELIQQAKRGHRPDGEAPA
ncbi:ABC transporter [Nocardioides sp. Root1257]|uniref:ABC transporter ATP-binding protein n=1 Tax=unclassified Nocardioides TaxID=2615069 RepID=UPI0006FB5C8D|nr:MULTISPECIES: ABC transporter ATP-binding protein [unclassified Nocardioides]KQW46929.1 ABC transporter [Nocardioides sp. Root1257]KRC43676.1 ABC transporter [Nocardioides sp. Root224]